MCFDTLPNIKRIVFFPITPWVLFIAEASNIKNGPTGAKPHTQKQLLHVE